MQRRTPLIWEVLTAHFLGSVKIETITPACKACRQHLSCARVGRVFVLSLRVSSDTLVMWRLQRGGGRDGDAAGTERGGGGLGAAAAT